MALISASETNETTSIEDSNPPVSSRLITRTFSGDDETKPYEIKAYDLSLTVRCTECTGGGETCATKYWKRDKAGYFTKFNPQLGTKDPTKIWGLPGLEEFILAFPEDETPRVEVSGDFCQLMDTAKKVLVKGKEEYDRKAKWEETVGAIIANMATPDNHTRFDVDLGDFLKGLRENRMGEPPVEFGRLKEDAQKEGVFRVRLLFDREKRPVVE